MAPDSDQQKSILQLSVKTFARAVLAVTGTTPNALGLRYFASQSSTSIQSSEWRRLLTERESVPMEVVEAVSRDYPGMSKWYLNSIYRALDPRLTDGELENLKGDLSFRCRRLLLEHPEYRKESNSLPLATISDLLPLIAIRSSDALAGLIILMRQWQLRRNPQNQYSAATGVRYALHQLKDHPVIGQTWDELVANLNERFSKVGTSVSISVDFSDASFVGKSSEALTLLPPVFTNTQRLDIESWRPIYEGTMDASFSVPEETDDEINDAFDQLCECAAVPIFVNRLLGGPAHVGFGIEDIDDIHLLSLTGVPDPALNFFAAELGVSPSTLLEVATRYPAKDLPSFKGQYKGCVRRGSLDYKQAVQVLELAERIALAQWRTSRLEELCAIHIEGLGSYLNERCALGRLDCPKGQAEVDCPNR